MADITYGTATYRTAAPAGRRRSLLARLFDALIEARLRQARRAIAFHLDVMPDDVAQRLRSELGRRRERI
jgi:hypothetical protein